MKDKKTRECNIHFPGKRDVQSGRYMYSISQGDTKCEVGMTSKANLARMKYSPKLSKILALIPNSPRSFLVSF